MSTLKMVSHGEKALKTTIQKNLPKSQKVAGEVSEAEFCYSQTIFYSKTSHSEFGRPIAVELFCGNSPRVKAIGYFRRRAPSWIFDKILNATLSNNLL